MNLNYNNFIDTEQLNIILNKNKEKKVICFGAGTAPYIVKSILPDEIKVKYYVDNNQRLWGTKINGELVLGPQNLLNEEKDKIVIFIVSQHALSICKELDEMGFKRNQEYFDLFSLFEKAFRIHKIAFQAEKMVEFINRIPTNAFDHEKCIQPKKIGVVAVCGYMGAPMIYDIGIFLLLSYLGYNTELIIDNVYSCENFTMYDGASKDIKSIIDYVIEVLHERFPKLTVKHVNENKKSLLNDDDIKRVRYQTQLNTIWQKSRQNPRTMKMSDEELYDKFYNTFYNNLESIKAFFETNEYDILSLSTALHYHRGLYMWMGEQHNMRVSNYDGANNDGKISWATNYPNGHHYDIPKIILGNYFTENEKEKIVHLSQEHFRVRQSKVCDGSLYNYQPVFKNNNQDEKTYDVIIPLNVMWDAAAIGINNLFETEEQWLIETIQFILENTNGSILVREHPVQNQLQKYNNGDYEEILQKNFGNNSRIHLAKYNEKINTYDCIERCKVVLPLSSTVGVEAAFLGKKVIVHTNCYYAKLDFVDAPRTKEEYFNSIKKTLLEKKDSIQISNNSWISYFLLMNSRIETIFSEANPEWLFLNIDVLSKISSVKAIINVIGEDVPIPYRNVLNIIQNKH